MNITLYQAAAEFRELLDQIDPETGELPEGLEQARAIVATKSRAVVAYMLEQQKVAKVLDDHAKETAARAKRIKRQCEWLEQYLSSHMKACGITKIRDDAGLFEADLLLERDEAIEVFDTEQLPFDYLREIPAKTEPDKTLIKRAIKDGFEVPGAKLVKRDRFTMKG